MCCVSYCPIFERLNYMWEIKENEKKKVVKHLQDYNIPLALGNVTKYNMLLLSLKRYTFITLFVGIENVKEIFIFLLLN